MVVAEKDKRDLCKKLWIENEPRLKKLCNYKLSGSLSEVDDVLADTALALWEAILNGQNIKNPEAWLYAVTNNLIKKKYAEINKEKEYKVAFDEENLTLYNLRVGYDLDAVLLTDEAMEKFIVLSDTVMTEEERELFRCVDEEKLKMKEIAAMWSTTESAVKQRKYRLTRKLKMLAKDFTKNY